MLFVFFSEFKLPIKGFEVLRQASHELRVQSLFLHANFCLVIHDLLLSKLRLIVFIHISLVQSFYALHEARVETCEYLIEDPFEREAWIMGGVSQIIDILENLLG